MHFVSVFISHSWSYSGHYEKLAEWIFKSDWSANGVPVAFLDRSVPKDDPIHNAPTAAALRDAIYKRINACDVVVIPTGMYAAYSNWIQKEIDGSKWLGKPILAVNPWGQEKKASVVVSAADAHCGWNKDSVVTKIWALKHR